jgi:E3 ubiquitin-protein ligase BIG BROTHER-like protein
LAAQERAYMMLTSQYGGDEYASSDAGSFDYDEDEGSDYEDEEGGGGDALDEDEEVADAEGADADLDPARYEDDEAFARALQDAEERDVAGRLMALAGIGDCECSKPVSKLCVAISPVCVLLTVSRCVPVRAMEQDDDEEVQEEEDDGEEEPQVKFLSILLVARSIWACSGNHDS